MDKWFKNRYSPHTILKTRIKKQLFKGKSPYQKIDVYDSYDFGRMLVLDDIVNVTEKDEFIYHEMMAHIPLFTHPNPEKVLVIGGGDGGLVREIAKHPQVKQIDLVEIDPAVINTSKRYLPKVAEGFKESRLNIFFQDGSRYVKNRTDVYDVIIVDSPDPLGAGKRLFQKTFYSNCFRALKADGVLTTHSETPTFKKEFRLMRSIYGKLNQIFPLVQMFTACIPSYSIGMWCFVFCSKKFDPLKDFQVNNYRKYNVITRYYNEATHRASFALPNFLITSL
jgi:spermidine synthase